LILNRTQHFFGEFLYADFRIHLQGMSAPVRGSHFRGAKGRMPEMPEQKAGATVVGLCGVDKERSISSSDAGWPLRIMRQPGRARFLCVEELKALLPSVSGRVPQLHQSSSPQW
jgi:hypothetical protein